MKYLFTILIAFTFFEANAQETEDRRRLDSIAFIDSIKAELALLFGTNKPVSYANFSTGIGNGYFTPIKAVNNSQSASRAYYSLNGAYNHKSGLGISLMSLFVPSGGNINFYQAALSPSYDYTRGKDVGFGASYTHYITRKKGEFFVSPIKHEFYIYAKYLNGFLNPSFALDFARGSQTDTFRFRPGGPLITVEEKIRTFSTVAAVDHREKWDDVFTENDRINFKPSLMLVAGNSNYGANFTAGRNTRALTRLAASRNRSTSTKSSEPFVFQSFAVLFDADYMIGLFYLSPQIMFDYTIPKKFSRWATLFSIRAGINF